MTSAVAAAMAGTIAVVVVVDTMTGEVAGVMMTGEVAVVMMTAGAATVTAAVVVTKTIVTAPEVVVDMKTAGVTAAGAMTTAGAVGATTTAEVAAVVGAMMIAAVGVMMTGVEEGLMIAEAVGVTMTVVAAVGARMIRAVADVVMIWKMCAKVVLVASGVRVVVTTAARRLGVARRSRSGDPGHLWRLQSDRSVTASTSMNNHPSVIARLRHVMTAATRWTPLLTAPLATLTVTLSRVATSASGTSFSVAPSMLLWWGLHLQRSSQHATLCSGSGMHWSGIDKGAVLHRRLCMFVCVLAYATCSSTSFSAAEWSGVRGTIDSSAREGFLPDRGFACMGSMSANIESGSG